MGEINFPPFYKKIRPSIRRPYLTFKITKGGYLK